MHYKIVVISLLMSGAIVAVENKNTVALPTSKASQAARIKELENRKIKIEIDAENLSARAAIERAKLAGVLAEAQQFWKPSSGRKTDAAFVQFVLTLRDMFEKGEDIEQLVSESMVCPPTVDPKNVQILFLAVAMQQPHVARIADEYKKLGQELLAINKELHTLKNAQN